MPYTSDMVTVLIIITFSLACKECKPRIFIRSKIHKHSQSAECPIIMQLSVFENAAVINPQQAIKIIPHAKRHLEDQF